MKIITQRSLFKINGQFKIEFPQFMFLLFLVCVTVALPGCGSGEKPSEEVALQPENAGKTTGNQETVFDRTIGERQTSPSATNVVFLNSAETRSRLNEAAPKWLAKNSNPLTASESPDGSDEEKSDGPDEALKFRFMQMRDEKGEIPIDGLEKARKQMDRMRDLQQRRAKASGNPEEFEIAGLAPGDWTSLGPGNVGGRIRSIVIDPGNANRIWVGSVSGGIWRSTNAGTSWQPVNDFMANLAVSTMAINPANPATMYAGTGEGFSNVDLVRGGGIFQSTDSGNTWNLLASTNTAAPAAPGCGVGSAPCPGFWAFVNRIAISPNGATILAAAGGQDSQVGGSTTFAGGIAQSTDGGATWIQRTNVQALDVDFDPSDSNNAVAGRLAAATRSTDGGQTWTAATFATALTNGGTAATNGRVELAFAPSSSNIVYASVNNNSGDVHQSTDGGQNFTRVNTGGNFLGAQGWYDNIIWVNPQDATFVIVGGVDLWRSTNSGTNFTQISQWQCGPGQPTNACSGTSAHADHHIIVAHPGFDNSANRIVYFGNDGGIFRADNVSTVGQTNGWTTNLNNNLSITQFYGGTATLNGTIFGGTQDNGTVRVAPPYNPQAWSTIRGGDGGQVAADPTDANYLYGETQNLGVFRSTDGGATNATVNTGITDATCSPAPCNPPTNFIAPLLLDPSNPGTLLAGGVSLWRNIDIKAASPPNWTAIKAPTPAQDPISAIAVSPTASSFIVVGHNSGAIFATFSGTTASPAWDRIDTAALPARFVTRLAIDNTKSPNWIYATFGGFSNDNVWVTKDLGTTWIDVSGVTGSATDLPAVPVRSILVNPANANFLYIGTEVGIFASEDGGATWLLPQGGPANVSVDELFLYQGDLLAATHGRGVYTTRAPLIDLPICFAGGGGPIPCPPGQSSCTIPGGGNVCCVVGNWECPCTWNNRQVPTQNDDIAIYCPITVNGPAAARNLRIDGRLSITSSGVSVQGDVVNFGLIESVAPFSSSLSCNNLLNVRPENAVTLRGLISINNTLTVRGNLANFGIITGRTLQMFGPFGATQNLSGTGEFNNEFLQIFRTARLETDVTLNAGSVNVQPGARLLLNNRTLTANGNSFSVAEMDLGTGTFNFRGNELQITSQDSPFGVRGTGTINVNPTGGTANFAAIGAVGSFQPSLRIQSGTINANFSNTINGSFIVDSGATFNLNQGGLTVNGDITVNGAIGDTASFTTSILNFNGPTFTNNGSVLVDFINFNFPSAPRTQTIAGAGSWNGTSLQIGTSSAPSTTTLSNDVTFNQGQFLIPANNAVNLANFTLTYRGSNFSTGNSNGGVIGTGTLRMQPASGTANLNGTGTDPIRTGVTIASGTVTPSTRVSGPFAIDPGAALSGGSLFFTGNTFTNNGFITSTNLTFGSASFQPINQQLGGTGAYTGTTQLFINPESTTTLTNDMTFAGQRLFLQGRINTGPFTLSIPCNTLWQGTGEAVGNVRRTNLSACLGTAFAFGNPFTTIQFTSGTPPTEIAVNTILSAPLGFPSGVRRTYLITPTGGSGYTATLRLHYLDSELNGNNESQLQLWRNNGTNWTMQGVTNRSTVDNWVEYAGVTQFSPWAISQLAPTAAGVFVGGRVQDQFGRGISKARVTLSTTSGATRTVLTNGFGYYHFDNVAAGQTYVFSVSHKSFQFATQIIDVTQELTDLNFIAEF